MTNINEINVFPAINFVPRFLGELFEKIPNLKNSMEYKGYTIKYDLSFKIDVIGIEDVGFIVLKNTVNPKGAKIFRFSYVKPEHRGKNIRNMLLEFTIKELGIKPIISDNNISLSSAKNYLKLLKNTDLTVSIYNKETKEKIPYTSEQNFLHTFDKELKFTNKSSNFKDGKNLVLMFEENNFKSALDKINEIYVGDFDIDDIKSFYFKKLKELNPIKTIKNNSEEIKIIKEDKFIIIGIVDKAFIALEKMPDIKYLQWTRSYIIPELRGRGIRELLLKTALKNNYRPLVSDSTLSIPAAKNFEKILKNPDFNVKIYDSEDDVVLPYKPDAKIYHSPEDEFNSNHIGIEYKDADKYLWLIESKSEIDVFTEEIQNMIEKEKLVLSKKK